MTSESTDAQPDRQGGTAKPGAETPAVLDEAARQMRAPWAAGIAGLLFAILFTGALILLRSGPLTSATDAQLAVMFATGGHLPIVIGGLYLAPFSGIMFLWFIAVVRDQIGEREDRFFATVFFGSGLLFVALVFVATAVASAPVVGYQYLDQPAPSATIVGTMRALSYTVLFAFATRAGRRVPDLDGHDRPAQPHLPQLVRLDGLPAGPRPPDRGDALGLDHPRAPRLGRDREPVHHASRALA